MKGLIYRNPKTAIAFVCAIAAVATVAYFYFTRLVPQTAYYGVTFADFKPDIQYKLGVPVSVDEPAETSGPHKGWARVWQVSGDPAKDQNVLPEGKDFKTFDAWSYDIPNADTASVTVSFGSIHHHVNEVTCYSASKVAASCQPVAGIEIGDTEDHVRSALGQPEHEELSGVSKTIWYPRWNAKFIFEKQKVYSLSVGQYRFNRGA